MKSLFRPALSLALGLLLAFNVSAKEKVTVFAAASLTNAMNELGAEYDSKHDTETVFSFASSSTLARQIAQGAPAELFLSANQKWMDYLDENKAIDAGSRVTLLRNTLVLIAPKSSALNQVEISASWDLKQALGNSRMAVGDPDHVPAGRYAKQALENLALWQQAEPLLARANSVRGALALVERGESSLGIVYSTDAKVAKGVKQLAVFPQETHKPISYPMALVGKERSKGAEGFYQFLQSDAAKAVFAKYGFGVN
ncbi:MULTISPECIES: molybdate ABC transporter substrate-binding protein [Shewanella]|uniref:Molybdate ABC transporter substrate-binding protein n=2 Tax=Unclassified Bacteria TaxID=49928 RepID=A0AAU6VRH7_UNCXX|nr:MULTISPECIES: molybdate ABC transporter substrate-binding protein [Shewanella]MCT8982711.1 molybdate ABC transporter substrate-binding protein [Shewanella algae]MDE0567623.1 molybdate ABC transporter substrate-binding protein [Shewanella sp. K8]